MRGESEKLFQYARPSFRDTQQDLKKNKKNRRRL